MKRFLSMLCLLALAAVASSSASAVTRTVHLSGVSGGATDFAGATGINDAVASIPAGSTGDIVSVTEAGTYTTVTLLGNRTYTVQGLPGGGVAIAASGNGGNGGGTAGGPASVNVLGDAAGPQNVTLKDLSIFRPVGSGGAALKINQNTVRPTTVTLTNVTVRHQEILNVNATDATGRGGSALIIQGGNSATLLGTSISLVAKNCVIESLTTGGTQRDAVLVNLAMRWLKVSMTNTQIRAKGGEAVKCNATNGQNWAFRNCVLNADYLPAGSATRMRAFEIVPNHDNSSFAFTSCTVLSYGPTLSEGSNQTGSNNSWLIDRCTLSCRRFGSTVNSALDTSLRMQMNGTNTVTIVNSILLGQSGQNNLNHGSSANSVTRVYHCTFWNEDRSTPTGTAIALNGAGVGSKITAMNNIFDQYKDSIPAGATVRRNHVIRSPWFSRATDVNIGADWTTSSLLSDLANFRPAVGSAARNSAYTSASITALLVNPNLTPSAGAVDRFNYPRPGGASNDVGAVEVDSVPATLSSFIVE